MILKANEIITMNNESYGNITGWESIPTPDDEEWPVPEAYVIPDEPGSTEYATFRKTEVYYSETIVPAEQKLKNATRLRKMTLGQLGTQIEFTIHSWLHMRFSGASSYGYRPEAVETIPNIDVKWDNASYNWLVDTYSSHVNPVFWKIHGWIDDRVEDWRIANDIDEIEWIGNWTGGPMSNLSSVLITKKLTTSVNDEIAQQENPLFGQGDILEEVLHVFLKSGVKEMSFSDEIATDFKIEDEATNKSKIRSVPKYCVRKSRRKSKNKAKKIHRIL